jgi:hypothetical protein
MHLMSKDINRNASNEATKEQGVTKSDCDLEFKSFFCVSSFHGNFSFWLIPAVMAGFGYLILVS